MKQILKLSYKVAIVFVIIFFTGCEIQEDIISNTNEFKVSRINYKEFEAKKNIFGKILMSNEKQKKSTADLGRVIFDSINNFFIDTDEIIFIERNSYNSFTFPIHRKDYDKNVVENLIYSLNSNGDYDTFISKYELTDYDRYLLSKDQYVDVLNKSLFKKINAINVDFLTNRIDVVASDGTCWEANSGSSQATGTNQIISYTQVSCLISNGGGGSSLSPSQPNYNGSQGSVGNTYYQGNGHASQGTINNGYSSNTTGGLYGSGSTYTIPAIPHYSKTEIVYNFFKKFISSNPALKSWWTNPLNQNTVNEISNYLYSNQIPDIDQQNPNELAVDLITQMSLNIGLILEINASSKSPANIDRSEIDKTTPAGARFDLVYNKLMTSPDFKLLFHDMFNNNAKFNVKFKIGAIISGASGNTDTNLINPTLNTITISPTFLTSANKLEIAKTIIHECIHAYLNVKLCDAGQGISIPTLNNSELFNLINSQYNGFNGNQDQHNFIYTFMLPTMQTILSQVKDLLITPANNQVMLNDVVVHIPFFNSPSTPFNWNDYYHNLVLSGLQDCSFFQNEIGLIQVVNGVNIPTLTINQILMQTYLQYIAVGHNNINP